MRISDWSSDVCSSDLTILPGRAVAKLDLRLVPNQTRAEAEKKLRAHLDKHGFTDVEVNVSGGYDPTEVAEDSRLVRSELATYKKLGVATSLNPRMAGSWPGATFTAPPVAIPAAHFGIGHRSEERRVGKECVSTCGSRGSRYH